LCFKSSLAIKLTFGTSCSRKEKSPCFWIKKTYLHLRVAIWSLCFTMKLHWRSNKVLDLTSIKNIYLYIYPYLQYSAYVHL
jgi:hypothetical protein